MNFLQTPLIDMAEEGDDGVQTPTVSPYEEAMEALSSLITKRSRAFSGNKGDNYDSLFEYLEVLELDEEDFSKMKVIHVAGTKGKGSTCTFTESILRNCGFHTGVFTSPHLIDVRERFRLDGVDICEEKFLAYFWWCFDRFKLYEVFILLLRRDILQNVIMSPGAFAASRTLQAERKLEFLAKHSTDDLPMPTYFRFLALLAFKIFAAEEVDVAILEVGLGGRFDATNVVQKPVVCGISSLGYDHMEILGNTLGEIAGEKAGIFKLEVPAFTVPQPDEAMRVLEEKASRLNVPLKVAPPLDVNLLNGLQLGLVGEHQYLNAGLAIALCTTWLQETGHLGINYLEQTSSLPEHFIRGLTTASLQGRAQIVPDRHINHENSEELVFYLDGAHSPESMEVCARWFSQAIKEDRIKDTGNQHFDASRSSDEMVRMARDDNFGKTSSQILLFNCMSVRDPQLLLPRLMKTCANNGVHFKKALFVPNISVYYKVSSSASAVDDYQIDLSWQLRLQKVWESLIIGEKDDAKTSDILLEDVKDDVEKNISSLENSVVFPSLPLAIKWLRDSAKQNQTVRFQVLVTGSLHLVGDVLKIIKR